MRVLTSLLLSSALLVSGCIYWPPEPRQQAIEWQFAHIPEHIEAAEAFDTLRDDYGAQPCEWEKWNVQVIETLSKFQPACTEDVEAYLSFVCFLADDEYPMSAELLATVSVHQTDTPDCTLLSVLRATDGTYEAYFNGHRVVNWDPNEDGTLRLWLEPRPKP